MNGQCNICGLKGDVVRDHDHKTKVIRGLLCNPCNIFLGTYEAIDSNIDYHFNHARFRNGWKIWLYMYMEKIHIHLEQDTGFKWTKGDRRAYRKQQYRPRVKFNF